MFDYSTIRTAKAEKKQHWREIDAVRKAHIGALNASKGTPIRAVPQVARPAPIKQGIVQRRPPAQPQPTSAAAAIVEIPDSWKDLNWPDTRDLAQKIVGPDYELKSRAEARAIIAAHKT